MQQSLTVSPESGGERLDKFLQRNLQSVSRTKFSLLIKTNRVLVDGQPKKPNYRLKAGQVISVEMEEDKKDVLKPFKFEVNIIYEDSDILVIEKPIDIIVHPPQPAVQDTLVNALLYMKKDLSSISANRPGVVHRLDRETSGCLVLAKNNFSHLNLVEQFRKRKIKKEYLTIVWGIVKKDNLVVDMPLRRDEKNRLRMKVSFLQSKKAHTEFNVKERLDDATFVSINLLTGRMHQIRVHLKFLGFPIVGDKKYGIKDDYDEMFLHAHKLGLFHPCTGKFMEFVSPIPERFIKFIEEHRYHNK
ncbi:MAG: RluA family pseudouridine synthase [Candidatus Omnitrophica bacterium]|jgi:23S rRNA pseudouridine1911/1915/1917 synthase|nr:RluA family pseudouridine synthase [Candidatus Omnitrophota bacterium]